METLRNGLTLTKTQEGLEVSGKTFDYRELLKGKGGKWNPQKKVWLFPLDTDFSDMHPLPQRPRAAVQSNMWVFDRLRDTRRRECCSQCKRELDKYDPQGPMWYVCEEHGKWKSDYDGT